MFYIKINAEIISLTYHSPRFVVKVKNLNYRNIISHLKLENICLILIRYRYKIHESKKYNTIRTAQNRIEKHRDEGKLANPNTYVHDRSFSRLSTGTLINSDGVKMDQVIICVFYYLFGSNCNYFSNN